MRALTLTLKTVPKQRIDCSPLTPDALQDQSLANIAAIELSVGNTMQRVDALFDITDGDSSQIQINNSHAKLDFVGSNMQSGSITTDGDIGA